MIVNGAFVKRDNKATDQFPGQPIRYPVEEKGRFVPASQKQWLKTFTIDSSPLVPQREQKQNSRSTDQSSHKPADPPLAKLASAGIPTDPPHSPWWGDRRARSLGFCCEWHMIRTRFETRDRNDISHENK